MAQIDPSYISFKRGTLKVDLVLYSRLWNAARFEIIIGSSRKYNAALDDNHCFLTIYFDPNVNCRETYAGRFSFVSRERFEIQFNLIPEDLRRPRIRGYRFRWIKCFRANPTKERTSTWLPHRHLVRIWSIVHVRISSIAHCGDDCSILSSP